MREFFGDINKRLFTRFTLRYFFRIKRFKFFIVFNASNGSNVKSRSQVFRAAFGYFIVTSSFAGFIDFWEESYKADKLFAGSKRLTIGTDGR